MTTTTETTPPDSAPSAEASTELTTEQREAVEALADGVEQAIAGGVTATWVASELEAADVPERAARDFVDLVTGEPSGTKAPAAPPPAAAPGQPPTVRSELRERYARKMLFGFLWAAGGSIVTAISYQAASTNVSGGQYVVAYGAILYGLVSMAIGYDGWSKNKD